MATLLTEEQRDKLDRMLSKDSKGFRPMRYSVLHTINSYDTAICSLLHRYTDLYWILESITGI